MAYNLRISKKAEAETDNAIFYYDNIGAALGDRFLNELLETYTKIALHPEYYSYISSYPLDMLRDIKMRSFPFVVVFEILNDDVIVTAVLNTNRNPDNQ